MSDLSSDLVDAGPPTGYPPAVLVQRRTDASDDNLAILLERREYSIGRSSGCDLVVGLTSNTVSRLHASIRWNGSTFEVVDLESSRGTRVNGAKLQPKESRPLVGSDILQFGDVEFQFLASSMAASDTGSPIPYEEVFSLIQRMSSLDEETVIARALDLLCYVSGVDRSLLVGISADGRIDDFRASSSGFPIRVSESSIRAAFETGEKVTRIVTAEGEDVPSESMKDLKLRRIWISPIKDESGRPFAAIYLDSTNTGEPMSETRERVLDSLVEQIGVTLRNVMLHAEVLDLNHNLEARVTTRTRELEASRAQLVSQDRLVTLGRLVASIAHELNNPAGALASLARTSLQSLESMLGLEAEIAARFSDSADRAALRGFLERVRSKATERPPDSRSRRELEDGIRKNLDDSGTETEVAARRLARIGLRPDELENVRSLLVAQADAVSRFAERVYGFSRGLTTIGESASSVARIVDRLKTYSQLDRAEIRSEDVHVGIQTTLDMMRSHIPTSVDVVTRFCGAGPILHNPGELMQVWTNLIDNALRAMGDSGTLTIETVEEADKLRVTVTDTGEGVPIDIADRLFDLDVTTRGPGAGLGLGLPICQNIVEKGHGGSISFRSEPGHTEFRVYLPMSGPTEGRDE